MAARFCRYKSSIEDGRQAYSRQSRRPRRALIWSARMVRHEDLQAAARAKATAAMLPFACLFDRRCREPRRARGKGLACFSADAEAAISPLSVVSMVVRAASYMFIHELSKRWLLRMTADRPRSGRQAPRFLQAT